jgi:hypothetical protein
MPEDVATQIHVLENESAEMQSRLEDARQRFLASSAQFLASWYWDAALSLVAEQQAVTNQLGPPRLARMKGEIRSLQDSARRTIDATVGADLNWWHKQAKDQWYAAASGTLPEWLIPAFEQAAKQLEEVIRKYGYVDGGSARYHLREVTFPQDLVGGINRYDQLKREAEQVKRRIDALKRARSQRERG